MLISRSFWILSVLVLAGCATTRGVVDLSVDEPEQATSVAPDVEYRGKVYVGQITDSRVFALKPPDPSIPSLKDGQIDNVELKARAIARKRNSFGKAMGDILLPEERTVVDVVRENITLALQNSGYEVVQTPQEDAITLDADIKKFWAWFTPGFWALKIEFQSELAFATEVAGLGSGAIVEGYAHQRHQAAGTGAWLQTIGVGMDDLRANLEARLSAPP